MEKYIEIIKIIAILIVIIILGVFVWNRFGDKISDLTDKEEVDKETLRLAEEEVILMPGNEALDTHQTATAQATVEVFSNYFIAAAAQDDQDAGELAKNLVSERGKNVIAIDDNTKDGLIRFVRLEDIPNNITLGEVTRRTETFAEITTTWHYPGFTEERYFYLVVENNRWRVDSIQLVQQTAGTPRPTPVPTSEIIEQE